MNPLTPSHNTTLGQGMRDLPPELACRIFLTSLSESPFNHYKMDEYGDIDMRWPASKLITPFTLGAVCRDWRAMAFREPLLWRSVYLVAVPYKADIQARLLEGWLARSGNLPLSIEIDCSSYNPKKWSVNHQRAAITLLETVFKYSTRCTTFRTRLPPASLLPPTHSNIPDPLFNNLTTLSIVPREIPFEDDDDDDDLVIDLFQDANNLRQVDIHEVAFEQLTISWANVVKVTATTVSLNDCIKILHAAPHIEECVFNGIIYFGDEPDPAPVVLHRLSVLILDFGELNTTRDSITHILTAPNLRKLKYITENGDGFPVQNFVSFVQRSQCPLADLTIQYPSMSTADVVACLSQVAPFLQNLTLLLPSNAGTTVTLKPPGHLSQAFPKLQTLTCSGPNTIIQPLFGIVIPQPQPHH